MIRIYESPETSEVSAEVARPIQVLDLPAKPRAQAIRNGTVLFEERGGRWVGREAVLMVRGDDRVVVAPDGNGDFEYEDSSGVTAEITASEAEEQERIFAEIGFDRLR